MKVLNLYSGIGGNRKLWKDVEVTAVELNPVIAKIYQDFFPDDNVVVGDAHQYLLDHYKEYDFIWSSPPCPTHSRARFWSMGKGDVTPKYPSMILYEEILLLKHLAKKDWVVENVKPYYTPLIPGYELGRHIFWTNIHIPVVKFTEKFNKDSIADMQEQLGFDLSKYKTGIRKDQILRNCVHPLVGEFIMNLIKNETKEIDFGLFAQVNESV